MNVKRFLYQVQQNLPKHEGIITWIEDSALKVGYGDTGSFEIRYASGVCYNAATEKTEEFEKLVEEADKTFQTVKEYIDLMDKAPELSARDFNMPYKRLAEFNGVVLGGTEHESTGDFEFATWNLSNNALYHGHYYNDYRKAKEDFAIRAGLIDENKIFEDKQLVQIFHCIRDTLAGYELKSPITEKLLEETKSKIEQALPNLDELIKENSHEVFEQQFNL